MKVSMVYYLRTSVPANVVKILMGRYILQEKSKFNKNYLLNSYISKNFNTSIDEIFMYFATYFKVSSVEKNQLQIYCDQNIYLGKRKLEYITRFLEYGNLDIEAPKIISRMMQGVIKNIKNDLGGI